MRMLGSWLKPAKPANLVKYVNPAASANAMTETLAHQVQPDLQAPLEPMEMEATQDNQAKKVPQALVATFLSSLPNHAKNAHQVPQDPKDQQDQQEKLEKKASQEATEVWAKTEVPELQVHPAQQAHQAQMANQEAKDQQAKTVLQEPKANQAKLVDQVRMDQQDPKETQVARATRDQQDPLVHQAQVAKMETRARKDQRAKQAPMVNQAKTLNIVLAHVAVIKLSPDIHSVSIWLLFYLSIQNNFYFPSLHFL
jgi:hypothetical protein